MDKPLHGVTETAVVLDGHLQVALDNMPGALVYTDENLNIVFCNDRFREMYPVPADLLRPGQPYSQFLRHLATHGYYGECDVDSTVARRVESLRHPTGKSFEDISPDGRCYRVMRRRAAAGGTVTVMTDVTEQKRAEQQLANKEAELHVALDNMPGALVYTDENLNIVFCNDRFREMYPVPADLLRPGRPYSRFLRHLATHGYYGKCDVDSMVARRVESLRHPTEKSFEDVTPDGRCYRVNAAEQEWRARGFERPFRMRVGISTGFATVGNFGSRDRMDYTIYGNQVNLAARLQSAAEPGGILLSYETNALVQGIVLTEEYPPMTVKGFVRPINVYKVLGTYQELVDDGRVVLQERDGLRVLVDLTKQVSSEAIKVLEEVLAELKRRSAGE